MFRTDLHVHSSLSDGLGSPELLVRVACEKGLRAVSVTDHDTFLGSLHAAAYARSRRLPIIVVPGAEIRIRGVGDFLVYCERPPKSSERPRSLERLLDLAEAEGCLVVPAHPLNVLTYGAGLTAFRDEFRVVECFNSWTLPLLNELTYILTRRLGKECLAASDAHVPSQLGLFATTFPNLYEATVGEVIEAVGSRRPRILERRFSVRAARDRLCWAIYRRLRT